MKTKGFTLIELLAVIVILSVILVITVPKILEVIEGADKNAYKESVELIAHTATIQYSTNEILNNTQTIPDNGIIYEFKDGVQYVTEGYKELNFKGDKPYSGTLTLTKNKKIIVEKLVSKNKKWCANKEENSSIVINKCDEIPIESYNVSTTNTTKSIIITVSPDDLNTYYYKINDGEYESSEENIKIYDDLEKNKTYTIVAKGCRKNDSVCEEKTVTITLPDLDIPTYSIASIPEDQEATNGWATSRIVTIDYNQEKIEGTDYTTLINQYIYASTEEELIQKISNNNWNICETDSCTLPQFTSETHIIARTTDGYNELANSIITITNFDTENPSAPVITGGSEDWTNTSRTISVSTRSIAASEIKKYQYYVSTSSTELSGGSWKDCTTSDISQTFTDAGTYYVFFRSQSYVGKYSDASNVQIIKIDTDTPTAPIITGGSSTWINGTRTISVSTVSSSTSGIKKYQYYISTSASSQTGGSWNDCSTSTTSQTITTNGTRYIFFRAVNNAGKTGVVSAYQVTKIDTGIPTAPVITGGSSTWKNYNQIIWVTTASTTTSGIKKYQYCEMTTNTTSGCSWNDLYNNKSGVTDSGLDVAYYHTYGDLTTAFTGNVTQLNNHYVNNGKSEGRVASNSSWVRTAQNISTQGVRYVFFRAVNNVGTVGKISTSQITKIDTSTPTAPVITGGRTSWGNYNQIVWVSTVSSSTSGIKKYQYYISTSNTTLTGGSWTDLYNNTSGVTDSGLDVAYYHTYGDLATGYTGNVTQLNNHYVNYGKSEGRVASSSGWLRTAQNISTQGVRYVFFRAVNNAGGVSSKSNYKQTSIDTVAPTLTWSTSATTVTVNSSISITCSDSNSGSASGTLCDSNGCGTSQVSGAYVIPGAANSGWTLTGTCTDNAGNKSSSTRTFIINY